MLVEQRTFNLHPGKVPPYLALYRDEGRAIQERYLGESLGVFVTECGPLNQVTVLWRFDSFAHRDEVRSRMKVDPEWKAYLGKIHPLMVSMENRILVPADVGRHVESSSTRII
ncbi:NIPSNAP family protein [Variovorax paradoxus]|uniref:NIPSNAP family protein n=1 Tax=Variovorax paradoxus TaxID=34073 RepID=UPI00102B9FEF|nr:NIPSNAP family protein [Variovorax paradoxus]